MKQRNGNSLDRSPVHLLHRAYQAAGDIFQAEMKVGGLTPRQLAVLVTIGQNEGLSQTGIVNSTGSDRSTVAEVIRRLQRRGLLQRRRTKEDARAYAVKLTNEGWRVLRMAEPMTRRIDERVLNALPTDHREQFIGALQTIVTILQSTSSRDGTPMVR
jgi:MarR family transcriptional regulator, temperature-dependent positive regulator of motility